MNVSYLKRLAMATLVVLVCVLVLGGLLLLTQSAINIFERLADAPVAMVIGFWTLLMAIAMGFIWVAVVLLWPKGKPSDD